MSKAPWVAVLIAAWAVAAEVPAGAQAEKPVTIGSVILVDSPWGHAVYRGIRDGVAEAGARFHPFCHHFDFAREKAHIAALVEREVDAIIMVPQREEASAFVIKKARDAGVPVVCVGICLTEADNRRYISAFYESDNFEVGYLGGAYLADWLEDHGDQVGRDDRGAVNLGIIHSGIYGVADRRRRGFRQALEDAGVRYNVVVERRGIEIDLARRGTREILEKYPEVDIIWADNSENTLAALAEIAVHQPERSAYLFGIEIDTVTAAGLRDPREILQAVASQETYEMARRAALDTIANLRAGRADAPYRHAIMQASLFVRDHPEDLDALVRIEAERRERDAEDPPAACWQR